MTTSATPSAPFVRVGGAILGLVALLAVLLVNASPASAHARLESSSPADGATLTAVPPEVSLRFNEPIKDGLNEVSVKSGSTDVADGKLEVEGNSVYQPVKYSMEPGKYTMTYKVVSADGHPVSGSVSFTYDPPEGDTGASGEPGATTDSSGSGSGSETSSSPEGSSSTSAGGTSDAAADPDATSNEEGTSPWWWAAGAAALVVVLGALGLLARGRRGSREDEDSTDEDRRE